MDVLKPPLIWLNGRCYRKNHCVQTENTEEYISVLDDEYHEYDAYDDEICDFEGIIESDAGYSLSIDVPSSYFKFIIGKKGETRRRIEQETHTQLRLPQMGVEGPIVISSRDKKGIISAKTRIDVLIDTARSRLPFTHFLSIPITASNVVDHFLDFKADVLRTCDGDRGVDGSIFQNPQKLHLTIGTMVLSNDKEVQKAVSVLESMKTDFINELLKGRTLMVFVNGLEYMNDDPNEVDVLYAKVEPDDGSDRLQRLVDGVVDRCISDGLMQREYERVKLHVTVMNTLFRKDPEGVIASQHRDSSKKLRESFDASNILKIYGDYDFNLMLINELHLSERYTTSCDGYYKPAAILRLT